MHSMEWRGGKDMQTSWRKLRILVLISFAFLLTGCLVTSVRPLSDETYPPIFDNSLLGEWIGSGENFGSQDKKVTTQILFEPEQQDNGSAYRITTHSVLDNQVISTTVLRGRLVEIGSLRILDTEIGDDEKPKMFGSVVSRVHLRGVHFFSKVTVTDNTLILSALRNEWFKFSVLEEGISLPCLFECRRRYDCEVLLTGTPRQLREFFREYGDRQELFGGNGSSEWRRDRPGGGGQGGGGSRVGSSDLIDQKPLAPRGHTERSRGEKPPV
jgi:hypothetical protein